jgi:hypothetical protein
MSNWLETLQSALADFDKPGRTLFAAIQVPGATPAELGAALRAIFGSPAPGERWRDAVAAAGHWASRAEGVARDLRNDLPQVIHQFEHDAAKSLKGNREAQLAAGFVITEDFRVFGRSPHGHVLASPEDTPWSVEPVRYRSGGEWLALGHPSGRAPRPCYPLEAVRRLTAELETQRLAEIERFQAEQRHRDELARLEFERSPEASRRRIAALEAELASLRAQQAPAG